MMNFKVVLLFAVVKCCSTLQLCGCACVKARHLTFMYNSKVSVFNSQGGIQFHNSLVGFMWTYGLHCFFTKELCRLDKGTNIP